MEGLEHISRIMSRTAVKMAKQAVACQSSRFPRLIDRCNRTVFAMNQFMPTQHRVRSHWHLDDVYRCQNCAVIIGASKTISDFLRGEIAIPAEFCNKCREIAYDDHLEEEKREAYRGKMATHHGMFCGRQIHESEFPDFENLKPKTGQQIIFNFLKGVSDGQNRKSAYIYGSTGVGKTIMVKALNNSLIQKYEDVFFAKATKLANVLRKDSYKEDYQKMIKLMQTVKILIVDDFGSHAHTPWVKEIMFEILDYRYENLKTTIITSNDTLSDVDKIDTRLGSRFRSFRWMEKLPIHTTDMRTVDSLFPQR